MGWRLDLLEAGQGWTGVPSDNIFNMSGHTPFIWDGQTVDIINHHVQCTPNVEQIHLLSGIQNYFILTCLPDEHFYQYLIFNQEYFSWCRVSRPTRKWTSGPSHWEFHRKRFFFKCINFYWIRVGGSDQGQCHCVSGCCGESSLIICYWEDFNFLTTWQRDFDANAFSLLLTTKMFICSVSWSL